MSELPAGKDRARLIYAGGMCRSIKLLRDGSVAAPSEEIEAAALQYIRKVSGFQRPAVPNHYALTLSPELDAATFGGLAIIDVEITEATKEIVLNAAQLPSPMRR